MRAVAAVRQPLPLQPLLRSVLAVLKAAEEYGFTITRTKLAKLLYFVDLAAVEGGETAFTGATWRWDNYGPYDHALKRAENTAVDMELVDRDDQTATVEYGACRLRLVLDIDDPLPDAAMVTVRRVVGQMGGRSAGALRDLSYKTPPMVEAETAGERGVLLDLSRARRARQARALLDRHHRLRASLPQRADEPGVGDELLAEMDELAGLRGRVNAEELEDR